MNGQVVIGDKDIPNTQPFHRTYVPKQISIILDTARGIDLKINAISDFSHLQIFCALYFSTKAKVGLDQEEFFKTQLTSPEIKKINFYDKKNLDTMEILIDYFQNLRLGCVDCSSKKVNDFCQPHWNFFAYIFKFSVPPLARQPDFDFKQLKKSQKENSISMILKLQHFECVCGNNSASKTCDKCCSAYVRNLDSNAEFTSIKGEDYKYTYKFESNNPIKNLVYSLGRGCKDCIKLSSIKKPTDKLTRSYHCGTCKSYLKQAMHPNDSYFINKINTCLDRSKALRIYEKNLAVEKAKIEKKIDVKLQKIKDSTTDHYHVVAEQQVAQKLHIEVNPPNSTSKSSSSTSNSKSSNKIPVKSPPVKRLHLEVEEEEEKVDYSEVNQQVVDQIKGMIHGEDPIMKKAGMRLVRAFDLPPTTKMKIFGVGWRRLQEPEEYKMSEKKIMAFLYIVDNYSKFSTATEDWVYESNLEKVFHSNTSDQKMEQTI